MSVDQSPIRGSRRSNPATYTGLLDPIRTPFARANGVIHTDLAMMAGVVTTCEECEGKRFQAPVLDHHVGGRDIGEVLAGILAD